jgi:predicted  nucleic acid-binding Zn-ribbon protein
MYENGKRPSWNMDKALECFVKYPSLKDAFEDAQGLIARHQKIARKYKSKIAHLEKQIEDTNSDKAALEKELRAICAAIEKEAA